jgi:hypothetical protein
VKDVFLFANKDRVPGVVAAGMADDDVRLFRKDVNDFAFAFVAPLGANQDRVHSFLTQIVTIKIPEHWFGAKHMVFAGRK